jgi:hypothetical protein
MSPPKKRRGGSKPPSSPKPQAAKDVKSGVLFETPLAKWWHRRIELRRCCVKETHTVKAA